MDQYLPILLLAVLSLAFAIGAFVSQQMFGPGGRLNPAKTGPYESGIAPRRQLAPRYPARFYLIGMIFVIFDIEIVFLYPFAVVFHELSLFGFIEMASFAVVVFAAFAYLISEGGLYWGPPKRLGSRTGAPVGRTLNSTVRRVSRPGVTVHARPSGAAPRPPARVGTGSSQSSSTGAR